MAQKHWVVGMCYNKICMQEGFWYHHAEHSYVMLVLWISATPCTIPDNASHQVGIAAFVYNDNREVIAQF